MKLIQEDCREPWQVLVACCLLNRTNHEQAELVLNAMLERYPTRESLAAAEPSDLEAMIAPLGLSKQRSLDLVFMAHNLKDLPSDPEKQPKFIAGLPGCGEYSVDAWKMFVLKERDFWPRDRKLCLRMVDMRIDLRVVRDFHARVYLHIVSDYRYAWLIGTKSDQTRDIIRITQEEFRTFKPLSNDPGYLARTWLDSSSKNHIPLLERAKELIMTVVALDLEKKEFIGKFESVEAATEGNSLPTGTTVIDVAKEEEISGFSLPQLTDIYNVIVGADKTVKGFSDKATAARRIQKAVENHGKAPQEKPQTSTAGRKTREPGEKSDREKVREFLVAGKEFTIGEVAALIGTSNSNASTTVQLLKTRPGKNHSALVTEKLEGGKHKVIEASVALQTEEPPKSEGGENTDGGN